MIQSDLYGNIQRVYGNGISVTQVTNKFLNEAFNSSMGTQRAAMGDYKKFCLALTNVGVPQLIAFDLVAVSPMSSMYGNVAYK